MFVIRLNCLLFVFTCISFQSAYCQSKSKTILEIENIYSIVEKPVIKISDTARLNNFADSVAKEENIEKTEYTRFYIFLQKKKLFQHDSIKIYYDQWLRFFEAGKTPGVKSICKFYYGECLFEAKDYSTGIQLMLEAISEIENIGYEKVPEVSIPFYLLSLHYYDFNNYRKSIEYAALAYKYHVTTVTPGTNNTIGLAYQKLGLYDSAIIKFRETMNQAKMENSPIWYSISSGNLGRTYCLKKNYKEGIPFLFTDVQMGIKDEPVNSAISALYIADAYSKQQLPDSAAYYIYLSKKILTDRDLWNSEKFYLSKICYYYYIQKAGLYKLLSNYEEAYKNLDTANTNKTKYDSQFDWQLLTSAEKRIENLEYQQSLNLLASQKKNQQLQIILLIIVLVSLVIIALLIFKRQKLKQQKEMQLAKEKEALLLLQRKQAEQELELAKQQLDDFMKRMEEKNSVIEQMKEGLLAIKNNSLSETENQSINQQLTQLGNATILTQSDWEDFRRRFEKVYPEFFTGLKTSLPGLTAAEERMLALLKLNIGYRQMANMLGISLESVRTARYRLRKKFASDVNAELYSL